MSDDNDFGLIGLSNGFTLPEAYALLYAHVVPVSRLEEPPSVEHIGFIAGVLCFNEEIEIVVKFLDGLRQYTKEEFSTELLVIEDGKAIPGHDLDS